jgi:hypothetical protein
VTFVITEPLVTVGIVNDCDICGGCIVYVENGWDSCVGRCRGRCDSCDVCNG